MQELPAKFRRNFDLKSQQNKDKIPDSALLSIDKPLILEI